MGLEWKRKLANRELGKGLQNQLGGIYHVYCVYGRNYVDIIRFVNIV